MEKEKIKTNAVGATSSRPHFEEKAKKQNGITLIALIITIIIMLILVGVTVATISDGGLLQKAKTAAEQTEEQAIYEQLVGTMKFGTDGKINVKDTFGAAKTVLGEKLTLKSPSTENEITESATIEVTGKNGKSYTYTITTEKIVSGELKFFYGYGYELEEGQYCYFFAEGICIMILDESYAMRCAMRYAKNGNNITIGSMTMVLSDNYSTMSDEEGNIVAVRDDSKIYEYNPVKGQETTLYENAIYISSDRTSVIYVGDNNIIIEKDKAVELEILGGYDELTTIGIQVNEDGTELTYEDTVYSLIKKGEL